MKQIYLARTIELIAEQKLLTPDGHSALVLSGVIKKTKQDNVYLLIEEKDEKDK